MRTINSVDIQADYDRIFDLAADIQRWPCLLPHYRWVKIVGVDNDSLVVEMAALKGWIPVKWISTQQVHRDIRRICYTHVGGLTKGMWVEWSFEPFGAGVHVTIVHEMSLVYPIVGSRLGKQIVGEIFVKSIADKTLQCIKSLAEE